MKVLRQVVTECAIIAHHEDITSLSNTLKDSHISLYISQPDYTSSELKFPAHIRCLINHSKAWERASKNPGYTLICEADFVPCKNFWNLPLPFKVQEYNIPIVAWLYSVGPVVYHYDQQGGFYGHNAGTVCYILNSKAALLWLEIFNDHKEHKDFSQYYMWEVEMPIQLRRKGTKCYISSKCYGEHGGIPNKEHNFNGVRSWHQAESLEDV